MSFFNKINAVLTVDTFKYVKQLNKYLLAKYGWNIVTIHAGNIIPTTVKTRNTSGDETAKCDFSVYLFILQLYK